MRSCAANFWAKASIFLSSPREAHRNLNARRSAKSPGGRPRVGPICPPARRRPHRRLEGYRGGHCKKLGERLVVTYASSREDADRVVAEIAGAGSNANRRRSQRLRSRRREAAVRGDQKGVRLARRAGEQRQRLQISALRSDHRRGETLASSFLRVGAAVNDWDQWVSWEIDLPIHRHQASASEYVCDHGSR